MKPKAIPSPEKYRRLRAEPSQYKTIGIVKKPSMDAIVSPDAIIAKSFLLCRKSKNLRKSPPKLYAEIVKNGPIQINITKGRYL